MRHAHLGHDGVALAQVVGEVPPGRELRLRDGQGLAALPARLEGDAEEGVVEVEVDLARARPDPEARVVGLAVLRHDAIDASEAVDDVVVELVLLHVAQQGVRAVAEVLVVGGLQRPDVALRGVEEQAHGSGLHGGIERPRLVEHAIRARRALHAQRGVDAQAARVELPLRAPLDEPDARGRDARRSRRGRGQRLRGAVGRAGGDRHDAPRGGHERRGGRPREAVDGRPRAHADDEAQAHDGRAAEGQRDARAQGEGRGRAAERRGSEEVAQPFEAQPPVQDAARGRERHRPHHAVEGLVSGKRRADEPELGHRVADPAAHVFERAEEFLRLRRDRTAALPAHAHASGASKRRDYRGLPGRRQCRDLGRPFSRKGGWAVAPRTWRPARGRSPPGSRRRGWPRSRERGRARCRRRGAPWPGSRRP